jgi:hypothetical protein
VIGNEKKTKGHNGKYADMAVYYYDDTRLFDDLQHFMAGDRSGT